MARHLLLISMLMAAMLLQNASAQDRFSCIEDTEKPNACEHFIIKKTDPRIASSSRVPSDAVCICVSDFQTIISDNQIQPDSIQQKILDEWEISRSELNQLLRY